MPIESLHNKNKKEIRLLLRLKRTVEEFIRTMLKYALKQVMLVCRLKWDTWEFRVLYYSD